MEERYGPSPLDRAGDLARGRGAGVAACKPVGLRTERPCGPAPRDSAGTLAVAGHSLELGTDSRALATALISGGPWPRGHWSFCVGTRAAFASACASRSLPRIGQCERITRDAPHLQVEYSRRETLSGRAKNAWHGCCT